MAGDVAAEEAGSTRASEQAVGKGDQKLLAIRPNVSQSRDEKPVESNRTDLPSGGGEFADPLIGAGAGSVGLARANTAPNFLSGGGEFAGSALTITTALATEFGLPPSSLLPLCLALGGAAAGNSARMRLPDWPGLVHPGLSIALCNDKSGRLGQALDLLLQPFRDFRDSQLLRVGDTGGPALRLQPVLEEDPLGGLAQGFVNNPDAAVLVVHHPAGLQFFVDALHEREGQAELRVLEGGYYGRSVSIASRKSQGLEFIAQPAITWILDAGPELLARIFEGEESLLEQVAQHLICLAAPDSFVASDEPPQDLAGALNQWRVFIVALLNLRASRGEFLLELSAEAAQEFQQLRWRQVRQNAALPVDSLRFAQSLPTNLAKLALCAALFQNRPPQLSGPTMGKTITLAQKLAADTGKLAATLQSEGQRLALETKASKMLNVLSQVGRSTPCELRRHYNKQLKEIHAPVLEHLIASGRVRRHPDGTVEAIAEN
jgi:hypothetical protein